MKHLPIISLLLLSICISVFSCKKGSTGLGNPGNIDTTANNSDSTTGFKDIYIAGFLNNGSKQVATYWKNGTAVILSDKESSATDIIYDSGYVYVVGYIYQNGTSIAAYWVNGAEHQLTDGLSNASASSISIGYYKTGPGANDIERYIYISGTDTYYPGGGVTVIRAVYWDRDGIEHVVHSTASTLNDIWASPDIYHPISCGSQGPTPSTGFATIWPDKVWPATVFTSNAKVSNTAGTVVYALYPKIIYHYGVDTTYTIDVYACGKDIVAGETNARATSWLNGQAHYFTNGSNFEYATKMDLANNHVYVCGYGRDPQSGFNIAKYWKDDGTEVKLSDNTKYAWATDIRVKGNNVLVCGYERLSASVNIAKYWKNGVAVNLSDGVHNAVASAMYAH